MGAVELQQLVRDEVGPPGELAGTADLRLPTRDTEPAADRLYHAITALDRRFPHLSARAGLTTAQRTILATLATFAISTALLIPDQAWWAIDLSLAVSFAVPLVVRLSAIREALGRGGKKALPAAECTTDADCPSYTVLIALYREAAVVPQLVAAMSALDYPRERLDVIFAIEADDTETRDALLAAHLLGYMRIVVVPEGMPRTKPRALCYALTFARGDYVTVYDAEDQPEADQLRKAASEFAAAGSKIGCLQAPLNVYNRSETWLTRQFAIEYTALFDALLPAYVRLNIPIPLGGTSNHFPRAVLEAIGGWDPYNVTEDADLGVRLARFGYRVGMLPSTTWEEAPPRARDWFAQRTRWQKGWLQTYFVHMRDPVALWRDLGPVSWAWFQVVIGGGLISAFVHPWLYVWAGWQALAAGSTILVPPTEGGAFWWIAVLNMAATCLAAISLALLTVRNRGFRELMLSAFLVPLYWLPISIAAYRAAWEWLRLPFYWAKTPHRPRRG